MTPNDFYTLFEHGGLAAIVITLWWLEREERKKLSEAVQDCLRERAEHAEAELED